jgi:hypothetical protein
MEAKNQVGTRMRALIYDFGQPASGRSVQMGRRSLIGSLAIGAASLAMVALGSPAASAATTGVNASFVGVGIDGPPTNGSLDWAAWSLTGVAVGSSPLAGIMSTGYAYEDPGFDIMSFTLSGADGSVSGNGFSPDPTSLLGATTLTGYVTAASGSYAGLLNHVDTITVDISPKLLYNLESEVVVDGIAPLPLNSLNNAISPSVILGSISIS